MLYNNDKTGKLSTAPVGAIKVYNTKEIQMTKRKITVHMRLEGDRIFYAIYNETNDDWESETLYAFELQHGDEVSIVNDNNGESLELGTYNTKR